jgi:Tfp pilus assembly protein FimT
MTTEPRTARRGISLMELCCVLVAVILLGAVLVPTLTGMRGNTRTKAGLDMMQSHIAKAREQAVCDGRNMKLAISADGKRIRVETELAEDDDGTGAPVFLKEEDLPDGVTASVADDEDGSTEDSGWRRVATFLANGTCKEQTVQVTISEDGVTPVVIRIRGVTGSAVVQKGQSTP